MTVFYESPFITGVLEIAEGFKSFFAGIGTELAVSITITHSNIFESFLGPETEENFIFAHVTPETLNKIVGKLKTVQFSSGNDNNISTKLLNSAIINQSTLF